MSQGDEYPPDWFDGPLVLTARDQEQLVEAIMSDELEASIPPAFRKSSDAVDPQADSTGKPAKRVESSSSSGIAKATEAK